MNFIFQPWQLLLVILAGWVNQQQQQIIEFQRREIDVLKEKLGMSYSMEVECIAAAHAMDLLTTPAGARVREVETDQGCHCRRGIRAMNRRT